MKKALIEALRQTLEGQAFADWYSTTFDNYIKEGSIVDTDKIEKDIARLFQLN